MVNLEDYTTILGVAGFVWLLIEFLVKPPVDKKYGDDPVMYGWTLNMAAVLLGIIISVVVAIALSFDAITFQLILAAIINGFLGGLAAIGGDQVGNRVAVRIAK